MQTNIPAFILGLYPIPILQFKFGEIKMGQRILDAIII